MKSGLDQYREWPYPERFNALATLPNGNIVGGGAEDYRIWTWERGSWKYNAIEGHDHSVTALAVFSNGSIASGSVDTDILIWEQVNGI